MNATRSTADHTKGPLGELPPPALKTFFGREKLVKGVVALAKKFEPTALVGVGGIGETSIALATLCHDFTKGQFGDNRWFTLYDNFTR